MKEEAEGDRREKSLFGFEGVAGGRPQEKTRKERGNDPR